MRPLDAPEVRALPGTEDASLPFWSPDGGQIAFAAGGELKRLTLDGGRVESICVLPEDAFQGGTWNDAVSYNWKGAGQRFLVKVPAESDRGERIHIVTNWGSLLE